MANFLILAHFNGDDASTTITNENGSGPALVFGGAGVLTTANSPPFGTAWADLTGADSRAETSTPISLTAPWCISVKMNLGGFTGCMVSIGDENTPGSLLIQRYAGDFEIREITPGPALNQFAFTNTNGIASNTTQLLTISCDSSNLVTVAVDGASKCSGTPTNTTFSGILRVGGRNSGGTFGGQATGYYDELAVIDDDAYYTTYPFTPPTSEYTYVSPTPPPEAEPQRTPGGSGGGKSRKTKKYNYDYSSPKEPKEPKVVEPAKAPVKAVTKKEKKSIPADVAEMMQLLESSQSVTAQVLAEQKAMRAAEERVLAEEMEIMAVIAQVL